MTATLALRGLAGVEHIQADGGYRVHLPGDPAPTPIKAGDRLRVCLEVADDTWIYAVSVIRQAVYGKLGEWAPTTAGSGVRVLWPGGRVLTAGDATMTVLIVIAARAELPWLRDLTRADCSPLEGKMPPKPPVSRCDHLYGLFWQVPRRPRGIFPPEIGFFDDGVARIPAIVARHTSVPYTAVDWQFNPRK